MKIFLKKINKFYIILSFVFSPLFSSPYPHLYSDYYIRIVNRRYISYLLFEDIESKLYITFILSHGPNYHAFKSTPYRLYFECFNKKSCLQIMKEIDNFLQTGYNLILYINGDFIKKIEFVVMDKGNYEN